MSILQPLGATFVLVGWGLMLCDRDNDFIGWMLGAGAVLLSAGWLMS